MQNLVPVGSILCGVLLGVVTADPTCSQASGDQSTLLQSRVLISSDWAGKENEPKNNDLEIGQDDGREEDGEKSEDDQVEDDGEDEDEEYGEDGLHVGESNRKKVTKTTLSNVDANSYWMKHSKIARRGRATRRRESDKRKKTSKKNENKKKRKTKKTKKTTEKKTSEESKRAKHVMDSKAPETFFMKTDFEGNNIETFTVKSDSECALKCSEYPKCEYWSYGTSGKNKNKCWLLSSLTRKEITHDRESGYYDPCQDASNFEDGVEFGLSTADLVKGGFQGIPTPTECCRKCVATKGCTYWTLSKNDNTCYVGSGYDASWQADADFASGTFIANADGVLMKPSATEKNAKNKKKKNKEKKRKTKKTKKTKEKKTSKIAF